MVPRGVPPRASPPGSTADRRSPPTRVGTPQSSWASTSHPAQGLTTIIAGLTGPGRAAGLDLRAAAAVALCMPRAVVLALGPQGRHHRRMTAGTSRTDWLLFMLLGFLWGSSFLFIKIGVEAGLPPFTLVMLRLLIGFGLLAIVVTAARERLPRDPRIYGHLFVMGAINIALPFSLITWAEQHVDSSLTSVLNAAVPIFVIPIGAIFLRDEPLTVGRVVGVLLGFVGVAVLVGFDPAAAAGIDFLGALAIIAATISYAGGAVYARRNVRGLRPMIPAL